MSDQIEPEFLHLQSAVDAIETCATEHEQGSPHKEFCLENRAFIVAMTAHRLGIDIDDIGVVIRHMFDLEIEDFADDSTDNVLDAKEIQ